jgi:hypothetical protein
VTTAECGVVIAANAGSTARFSGYDSGLHRFRSAAPVCHILAGNGAPLIAVSEYEHVSVSSEARMNASPCGRDGRNQSLKQRRTSVLRREENASIFVRFQSEFMGLAFSGVVLIHKANVNARDGVAVIRYNEDVPAWRCQIAYGKKARNEQNGREDGDNTPCVGGAGAGVHGQ